MNHMKIGWFYVRVCSCGAVLQSIQVTPWNAREVGKFKESAARCGYDTEHVTETYFEDHEICTCEEAEQAS